MHLWTFTAGERLSSQIIRACCSHHMCHGERIRHSCCARFMNVVSEFQPPTSVGTVYTPSDGDAVLCSTKSLHTVLRCSVLWSCANLCVPSLKHMTACSFCLHRVRIACLIKACFR